MYKTFINELCIPCQHKAAQNSCCYIPCNCFQLRSIPSFKFIQCDKFIQCYIVLLYACLYKNQEHRKAGQYTPEGLYQKMGATFRLLKPKGQEHKREHIQQKKTMMLSELWLHFNIMIIFVMTLFNILSDLPRYSYKIKTITNISLIEYTSTLNSY